MLPFLWTCAGCLLVFSFIFGAIGCLQENSILIFIQGFLLICCGALAFLFRNIFVTEIPKNNSDLVRAKGIFWHLFAKTKSDLRDRESFENLQERDDRTFSRDDREVVSVTVLVEFDQG